MASDLLKERFEEIEQLCLAAGLKPYDVQFFEVPSSVIYEVASYGLPTRYSHWSFGRSYQYQQAQGEMGFSHIYELILNNDPSYAFLDKNNTDTANLMIAAHCIGHSDVFKNNIMFKKANESQMIQVAKRHAEIIDGYRKDYGDDEVDEWLDAALALENHIDVYLGLKRSRYPKRHIEYKERVATPWEDVTGESKPLVSKELKGLYIPPHPEKDVLWFLSEYANLDTWQKTIFDIVRRESYYFFPQYRTKILNEGWASYWHAEIMKQYALGNDNDYGVTVKHQLTSEEHLDFLALHEKVVQPGLKLHLKVEVDEIDRMTGTPTGRKVKIWNPILKANPRLFSTATRLNPYYLGFRLFRDIKERWDKYFKEGYYEDEWGEKRPVTINGDQKIREVMENEDDVSFLRNYLTDELAHELHLFSFGNTDKYQDDYFTQEEIIKRNASSHPDNLGDTIIDQQIIENQTIAVRSKELKKVLSDFAKSHSNYGVPTIAIRRVDEAGMLRLEHLPEDTTNLDITYAEHVLKYVGKIWGRPVELVRKGKERTWIMTYDGIRFDVGYETVDYPETLEARQPPSSW